MELETILKTDEFKKAIRDIAREQMSQTYQDMDEIRRSPAGLIIRIEGEIKSIKQNMVTKEEFKSSLMRLESRIEGLEGRFGGIEGKFEGLEGRLKGIDGKSNLITGLIFVMLTIYGALIAKLIFFP